MKLVTLYKETKTGAIQQYDIETIDDSYVVTQGQVGGKMQKYVTVCKPKNVGKKNETSGPAQAKSEALSKHAKQLKKGYTIDPSGEVHVRLPQKVQTYSKHMKKVIFPCFTSPKLNGVNATYRLVNDTLELTSRGGEQYPLIDQHLEAIKQIMEDLETDELNGELYIHDESLQDITSAVKKYNHLTSQLVFNIFELPGFSCDYTGRLDLLDSIGSYEFVKTVAVGVNNSHEELDVLHDTYVDVGYEGLIIRNAKGLYIHNQRSNDVFKLKKAQDAEFYVEGHVLDKYGHAVFRCAVDHEKTFKVKLKGTADKRLAMAAIASSFHGKWLKVEFEMLSNDGIPLKPVGIIFRKCDANGSPKE